MEILIRLDELFKLVVSTEEKDINYNMLKYIIRRSKELATIANIDSIVFDELFNKYFPNGLPINNYEPVIYLMFHNFDYEGSSEAHITDSKEEAEIFINSATSHTGENELVKYIFTKNNKWVETGRWRRSYEQEKIFIT